MVKTSNNCLQEMESDGSDCCKSDACHCCDVDSDVDYDLGIDSDEDVEKHGIKEITILDKNAA